MTTQSSKLSQQLKSCTYLSAYLIATLSALGYLWGGLWSFATPLVIFALVPILELFTAPQTENLSQEVLDEMKGSPFYHTLLLLVVPIHYGLLALYLWRATQGEWSALEWIGCTLSMGIACGSYGINVAHELGHCRDERSRLAAKALLLTSLYMHFFIEHNRGHHAKVATAEDPASARLSEGVYAFWWRSVTGSFISAWRIEARRLERKSLSAWSWDNQALRFVVCEVGAVIAIGLVAGYTALIGWICAAIIGFTLLEVINYIEHYGLERSRDERGRYETVTPAHSWNSDHVVSRVLLFELSRHADHHAHPRRSYQELRHFPESYQLPTGYPGMIMLALVPPLYRALMARQIERETLRTQSLLTQSSAA